MIVILESGERVTFPDIMEEAEAMQYVAEEKELWAKQGKKISSIDITLADDDVRIDAKEKSPISRIRRITGYQSKIENWNDAKQQELKNRYKHMAR